MPKARTTRNIDTNTLLIPFDPPYTPLNQAICLTENVAKTPTKQRSKRQIKTNISDLQQKAREQGGLCLSTEYITARTHYQWQCREGHQWPSRWHCVKAGSWCHECRKWQSGRTRRKYSIKHMQEFAEKKGGQCCSEQYIEFASSYDWQCASGHKWQAKWGNILNGTWCPYCSNGTGERICRAFFEQLFNAEFPKIKPDWLISENGKNRLELDGYCPALGIAFEHQGSQHYVKRKHFKDQNFHTKRTSQFEIIQRRDALKVKVCSERGILLVQIPSILEGLGIENVKPFIREKLLENYYPLPPDFDQKEVDPDLSYHFNKLEELKTIVEAKGGQMLSTIYISSNTRYELKCREGHTWFSKGDNIKLGKWCKTCAGIDTWTIEYMHQIAGERNGRCLSDTYLNNRTKILWECEQSHQWLGRPSNVINKGSWCKKCAEIEKGKKRRKYDMDDLQHYAAEKGGRCLSDSYTGSHGIYEWECAQGYTWPTTFDKILQGYWCSHCANNAKKTLADLQKAAQAKGGVCLATEYKNIKTNYLWKCGKGHEWNATADSVLRGSWCGVCSRNNKTSGSG